MLNLDDMKYPKDKLNTLRDAQKMIIEKSIKIEESNITQYIQSAISLVEARGENLDDYALIKVNNPMTMKDDNSITITSQWRIIKTNKLENVPVYNDED